MVENNDMRGRYSILSLGQRTADKIEIKIKQAAKRGDWIMLENYHLASVDLEAILDDIDFIIHKDYRLWLTSASTSHIPIGVLKDSIKIAI